MGTWGEGQGVPPQHLSTPRLPVCRHRFLFFLTFQERRPEFHAWSLQSPETLRGQPPWLQPLRDGLRLVWESSLTAAVSQPDRI